MKKYSDDIEACLTARHKKCIEICGDIIDKRILNIGCYNSWFERAAIEKGCKEIFGIDINDNFLELSKKNVRNAKFIKASIFRLPFKDSYFDLITMFDVLEHLPKNRGKEALAEIRRVLKSDGELIISTPKTNLLSNFMDPAWYFGHRHYSSSYITSLLRDTGFDVKGSESAGGFYELLSMILLYFFKWVLGREVPFKNWFDKKRDKEYQGKSDFVTLFMWATK